MASLSTGWVGGRRSDGFTFPALKATRSWAPKTLRVFGGGRIRGTSSREREGRDERRPSTSEGLRASTVGKGLTTVSSSRTPKLRHSLAVVHREEKWEQVQIGDATLYLGGVIDTPVRRYVVAKNQGHAEPSLHETDAEILRAIADALEARHPNDLGASELRRIARVVDRVGERSAWRYVPPGG